MVLTKKKKDYKNKGKGQIETQKRIQERKKKTFEARSQCHLEDDWAAKVRLNHR